MRAMAGSAVSPAATSHHPMRSAMAATIIAVPITARLAVPIGPIARSRDGRMANPRHLGSEVLLGGRWTAQPVQHPVGHGHEAGQVGIG